MGCETSRNLSRYLNKDPLELKAQPSSLVSLLANIFQSLKDAG